MPYCCETNDGGRNVSRTLAWSEIGCVNCSLIVDTPYFEYAAVDQVDTPTFEYEPAVAVEDVTFTPTVGEFAVTVDVELATTTPGATIYYTLDGSPPDDTDTEYTAPITIVADTLIRAIAYLDPLLPSNITQQQMTALVPQQVMIERNYPDSVIWFDDNPVANLTVNVGTATNLIVRAGGPTGSACTFDVVNDGVALLGVVAMGADGTDGNTYTSPVVTLPGTDPEVIIALGVPVETASGYFRAGGNTSRREIIFYIYSF